MNIQSVLSEIEQENEKHSWDKQTKIYWRINLSIDGYGMSRDFPETLMNEIQMREWIKKTGKKGSQIKVSKITTTIERII